MNGPTCPCCGKRTWHALDNKTGESLSLVRSGPNAKGRNLYTLIRRRRMLYAVQNPSEIQYPRDLYGRVSRHECRPVVL